VFDVGSYGPGVPIVAELSSVTNTPFTCRSVGVAERHQQPDDRRRVCLVVLDVGEADRAISTKTTQNANNGS
jgi:hypothetical protein